MNSQKITFHLEVLNLQEHLFELTMKANLSAQNSFIIQLPSWIPGSYMIRDFAKNLHLLVSKSANLELERLNKQSWRLSHKDGKTFSEFELSYQIYAYDLSVRSAYINDQYAFFNGTSVFLYVEEFQEVEHQLFLNLGALKDNHPSNSAKPRIATAMTTIENKSCNGDLGVNDVKVIDIDVAKSNYTNDDAAFYSKNYFEFIDHPVVMGEFDQYTFDCCEHKFHLLFTGSHPIDMLRIESDLKPIIEHHIQLFDGFPCSEYYFMTLLCDNGFGGLEHMASTVLQYNRFDIPMLGDDRKMTPAYQQFLSLCSHELFHTWHVKRIKPKVMHQPNLSSEVYTPQMWIYEGFTSFYDDLSLARSTVIAAEKYVQVLNENITRLLRTPGRAKQSVSESSFEAWSKFYKQDAGSVNHIVSYYNKGAIVALCLDIMLRQHSDDKVSLDNVMQVLWRDYANTGTSDEVITNICKQEFDLDLSSFLHMATKTTMDLPLPTLLQYIGLDLQLRGNSPFKDKGGNIDYYCNYDVGAMLSNHNNILKVDSVLEQRAASIAGLQVGDIIVALNEWQCDEQRFVRILNQYKEGEKLPLHVLRDNRLIELEFTLYPIICDTSDIRITDKKRYLNWLGLN